MRAAKRNKVVIIWWIRPPGRPPAGLCCRGC